MTNPFTPGNGVEPKFLAGREEYLQEFSKSLEASENGLPQNMVVYGLRGTGKTVLARHYRLIAEAEGWAVIERELNGRLSDEGAFGDCFGKDIAAKASEISVKARVAETGKALIRTLKPESLTAYGITYKPYYEEPKRILSDYLEEILMGNWPVFQKAGKKGVVLVYDEMHSLRDAKEDKQYTLSSLLESIAHVQRKGARYYLCACGLPNLKTNLKGAKTYTERMFHFQQVGNLQEGEARKALVEPARREGFAFEDALVSQIIGETDGYPYFLQFYGYYLLEDSGKNRISSADFKAMRPGLLERLDKSFFEDRFELASASERKILLAMAKSGSGDVPLSDVKKATEIDDNSFQQMFGRLAEKGLVYRVGRGRYSFTIPLFKDYLKRIN